MTPRPEYEPGDVVKFERGDVELVGTVDEVVWQGHSGGAPTFAGYWVIGRGAIRCFVKPSSVVGPGAFAEPFPVMAGRTHAAYLEYQAELRKRGNQ